MNMILGYIDGGTAAAIAAIATGGMAGAKVGLQSVMYRFKSKKNANASSDVGSDAATAPVASDSQESAEDAAEADHVAP